MEVVVVVFQDFVTPESIVLAPPTCFSCLVRIITANVARWRKYEYDQMLRERSTSNANSSVHTLAPAICMRGAYWRNMAPTGCLTIYHATKSRRMPLIIITFIRLIFNTTDVPV